jgi:DNA polymerase-3 subunit delta'
MYNWNIIGHKKQLELIEDDIKNGKISHAYLFTGPSSVGKFAIAKMMVNIMQCPNNLCRTCPTCIQLQKGSHADTVVLDDDGESIKIEQIRDIIARLNMTTQANYKILLIKKAERLTPEAANCLLKTLEEPPPDTVIILTTNNIREILPTIVSRARLIKFTGYSEKFLYEKLKPLYPDIEDSIVEQVCSLAIGKSGKAIKLLNDANLLASYRTMYNILCEFLEDKPVYSKFKAINDIIENGTENEFLDVFSYLVRNRLYKSLESGKSQTSVTEKKHFVNILKEIEETKKLLKKNINMRLALENLALKATL